MNIIETRAIKNNKKENSTIKNIPLFSIEKTKYSLEDLDFKNIIFQSSAAVEYFKELNILKDKKVFAMGGGTKETLAKKGISCIYPKSGGSEELLKIIKENLIAKETLIVKGKGGLSILKTELTKLGLKPFEITNYERRKFESYKNLVNYFKDVDAIIFSSKLSAEIYFEELHNGDKIKFFGISERINNYVKSLGHSIEFIDYFSSGLEERIKKLI